MDQDNVQLMKFLILYSGILAPLLTNQFLVRCHLP